MIKNKEELTKALTYRETLKNSMYQLPDCRNNAHAEFRRVEWEIKEYEKGQNNEQ